jgi:hypothetical protein
VHNKKGAKMNSKFKIVAVRQSFARRMREGTGEIFVLSAMGGFAARLGRWSSRFSYGRKVSHEEVFKFVYPKLATTPSLVETLVATLNSELPKGAEKYRVVKFRSGDKEDLLKLLNSFDWKEDRIIGRKNKTKMQLKLLCRSVQAGRSSEIDKLVAANRILDAARLSLIYNAALIAITPLSTQRLVAELFFSGGAALIGRRLGASDSLQRGLAYGGLMAAESLVEGRSIKAAVLFALGAGVVPRLARGVMRKIGSSTGRSDSTEARGLARDSVGISLAWLIKSAV